MSSSGSGRPLRARRIAAVLVLVVLAPVSAEYLLGYDTTTGHALPLLAGLLVLGPLYGAPAVLIREVARRRRLGWPGIVCFAAAWGVLEAGVVDQSMFNPSYRDIPYWDLLWSPTRIPGIEVSAFAALTFVTGHVVFSLGAPIAFTEALFPDIRHERWLGRTGVVGMVVLAVLGAAAVGADHQASQPFSASWPQLTSAFAVVAALVVLPFGLDAHGREREPTERSVPPPILLGAGAFVAAAVVQIAVPTGWWGFLGLAALVVGAILAVSALARSRHWTPHHELSLTAGALLGCSAAGFLVVPLGDVSTTLRLGHHVVLTAALLGLLAVAVTRRPRRRSAPG